MTTAYQIGCIVATLLSLTSAAAVGQPAQVSKGIDRALTRRLETNYVGCSDDQKSRLGVDFADAAALGNIGFSMDRSSTAFTHYLRPEDGDLATGVMSAVASNNDPTNPSYTFSVRCAANGDSDCSSKSLAVTDARPQTGDGSFREMKICPLYFTADATKNNLASKKYDGNKRGSWCQTEQHFRDFETGGHTLLHEMTHLDSLCNAANMPTRDDPEGFTTHATEDVDGFGDDYPAAARAFLDTWVNNPGDLEPNALKPYQNAENIAAAATEWWFIKSCGFTDIDL